MKLGEIEIEALKLMFATYNLDLQIDKISDYMQDESLSTYLLSMPGSINRCFSVIEDKGVLPSKTFDLKAENGVASGRKIRFDLPSLIDDFYAIDRIIHYDLDGCYNGDASYFLEGQNLVLDNFDETEEYRLIYKPKLKRITSETSLDDELDIPENIVVHIPYYIKGELYRDDEPNEAGEARNWFEAAMTALLRSEDNRTNRVKTIFNQTEQ